VPVSAPDISDVVDWIASRAGDVVGDAEYAGPVQDKCRELMDEWDRRRRGIETGRLSYTLDSDNLDPLLDDGLAGWGRGRRPGRCARSRRRRTSSSTSRPRSRRQARLDVGAGAGPGTAPPVEATELDETDDTDAADEAGLIDNIVIAAAPGEPER